MIKEERLDFIVKELQNSDKIYLEELAKLLSVSEDTVRRDIHLLDRAGLLSKVRGGAIRLNLNPLSFTDRSEVFSDGKKTIALKARHLLQNVRTIFMDGGTTNLALASALPLDTELRIITNNMPLLSVLSNHNKIELVVLGGFYNKLSNTTNGVQTCKEIEKYRADLYFMGACAIDSKVGITASILEEGEVKVSFAKSAQKTIVLSNHEKLETTDFYKVTDLSNIDTLITDLPSDSKILDNFRRADLQIL